MADKFLNETGVATIRDWVKNKFVSDNSYVHTDNNYTTEEKNKLAGIAGGAEVNVQADWNETDSTSDAYIANKPTIPTEVEPASVAPLMDGTAAIGTSSKFAREDHIHPSDTSKAPIDHAVTTTTYGIGTSSNYGHVKLSDVTNGTSAAASGGTAATPKAVSDALTAAKNYADSLSPSDKLDIDGSNSSEYGFTINNETTIELITQLGTLSGGEWYYGSDSSGNEIVKKSDLDSYASKNHADTTTTYGGATASNYGHVQLSDSYTATGTAANSLAPSQKALSDGLALKAPLASPGLTGTPTAPTASAGTSTTQIATTAFVQNAIDSAQVGAAMFQGTINANTAISNLSSYKKGWYWVVATAGTYVGETCEVGDMIFCVSDKNTAYSANDFSVIQSNIDLTAMTVAEINAILNA